MTVTVTIKAKDGEPETFTGEMVFGIMIEKELHDMGVKVSSQLFSGGQQGASAQSIVAAKLGMLQRILDNLMKGTCPDSFRKAAQPLLDELNYNIATSTENESITLGRVH